MTVDEAFHEIEKVKGFIKLVALPFLVANL
jgi:hypothetical protein